jgi:hypothetical protein
MRTPQPALPINCSTAGDPPCHPAEHRADASTSGLTTAGTSRHAETRTDECVPMFSATDIRQMTASLITVWAARTGRVLRDVPISELTADELEEFWTDDQLEPRYTTAGRRR